MNLYKAIFLIASYLIIDAQPMLGMDKDRLSDQQEAQNKQGLPSLVAQPTDLVVLDELDLQEISKELDALANEASLPKEKATLMRKRKDSLIALKEKKEKKQDPSLAAMELAAYEVAYNQLNSYQK